MALGTNPAFRSRSLVRLRIGAFRASDAGSNPAGSMVFYHTLMVRRPSGAVSELAFVGTLQEILRGFAEPSSSFERDNCRLYSPCRSHLYRRDSIGPLEGFCMNASFARHVQRP